MLGLKGRPWSDQCKHPSQAFTESSFSFCSGVHLNRNKMMSERISPKILETILSDRETDVLDKLSKRCSTFEVEMYLSFITVKTDRRSLLNKLNARNTAHLIRIAFELRLLKPQRRGIYCS